MTWDVMVIGAGAAGLLAATRAAERGRRTLLLEKNPHPGVKILMSGGSRCNLTQATDVRGIVREFGQQGAFLHSALARLGPRELVELVEQEGVPTKVEETGKIFPQSDRAEDILQALLKRFARSGAVLSLGEPVLQLARHDAAFRVTTTRRTLDGVKLIVTTGGKSYPGCGTSGDAYAWLAALGHTIVPPRPALTPVTTNATWVRELRGITLSDVQVRVLEPDLPPISSADLSSQATGEPTGRRNTKRPAGPRELAQRRGSLLFTHFGLSGPVILDVSRVISGHPIPHALSLSLDLLPNRRGDDLDEVLRAAAQSDGKRAIAALLAEWLPRRLAEVILDQSQVATDKRVAELSKADRGRIVVQLKSLTIAVSGTMGFRKAEVTAGGVALREVDSRTMESKLVPGLYLAGEVLDLDGPIGGYNFQAAFSTGMLAGESV